MNVFSQYGEEQFIRQILTFVDVIRPGGTFVEFGASRGADNSNFFVFGIEGRQLIQIEMDTKRYKKLMRSAHEFPSMTPIYAQVGTSSNATRGHRLDHILAKHGFDPGNVSIVSIDVDGDDAAIFEDMGLEPLIAIVEFNPWFAIDSAFRNPKGRQIGNSLRELLNVAEALNMYLVHLTQVNAIFAHEELVASIPKVSPADELHRLGHPRFAWGYDGSIVQYFTDGRSVNLDSSIFFNGWSKSVLLQPTPSWLRGFGRKRLIRRTLHTACVLLLHPYATWSAVAHKFGIDHSWSFRRTVLRQKMRER